MLLKLVPSAAVGYIAPAFAGYQHLLATLIVLLYHCYPAVLSYCQYRSHQSGRASAYYHYIIFTGRHIATCLFYKIKKVFQFFLKLFFYICSRK